MYASVWARFNNTDLRDVVLAYKKLTEERKVMHILKVLCVRFRVLVGHMEGSRT